LGRARENPEALCNGKIVNVTSIAGLRGTIGQINYAAAKAGVLGITMSAAREWGRYGINVNCVAFGMVETRMTETIRTDPRFADQYKKQIALGRYSSPEDVAPAVVFFASDDANYVTGQILNVCGGADIHV
jgi:3-oxoacyl-[acyl-carrier protein] reductase